MNVYIYDGPFEKGKKGHYLIKKAIGMYCLEKEMNFEPEDLEIAISEKGKPYLINGKNMGGIEFSLSHSEGLWMCLVGEGPCGIDVQYNKACSFEDISKKYFTRNEQHYVDLWGQGGFFDIWVRREALGKLIGDGFFGRMPELVSETFDLRNEIQNEANTCYFQNLDISEDIKCAICTLKDEQAEIRAL